MTTVKRFAFGFILAFCALAAAAQAQTPSVSTINLTPDADKVRVSAVGDVLDMRVAVSDEAGDVVFESGPVTGEHLDWTLGGTEGARVHPGTYTMTVTYRTSAGKLRRRVEQVFVTQAVSGDAEAQQSSSPTPTAVGTITGEGAANRVAKFTGANTIGNSTITESAGKVGIGTTAPAQSVHVVGATSRLRLQSTNGTALTTTEYVTNGRVWQAGAGGSTAANGVANKFFVFDQTAGQFRLVVDTVGNFGIGTTAPASKLTVNGGIQILGAGNGIKFPDGSIQTVAATDGGGLASVTHNATLTGAGTAVSPLGVAVPLTLSATSASPVLLVTNTGTGTAISATGAINTSKQYNLGGGRVLGVGGSGITSTFVGLGAGSVNTANTNTFVGYGAGSKNTTGLNNTFVGYSAGFANLKANNNTFVGALAGLKTVADFAGANTFFGSEAGKENTEGAGNTFIGQRAGTATTDGDYNTFVGAAAGVNNTEGNDNIFIGRAAGLSNTTELGNILIGDFSNGAAGVQRSVAIGLHAQVTQSNSIVLGGINGINGANFNTNVGIGVTAPKAKLHVKGGDVFIAQPNSLVITSPNGTCWQLRVSDTGTLFAASVTCP